MYLSDVEVFVLLLALSYDLWIATIPNLMSVLIPTTGTALLSNILTRHDSWALLLNLAGVLTVGGIG